MRPSCSRKCAPCSSATVDWCDHAQDVRSRGCDRRTTMVREIAERRIDSDTPLAEDIPRGRRLRAGAGRRPRKARGRAVPLLGAATARRRNPPPATNPELYAAAATSSGSATAVGVATSRRRALAHLRRRPVGRRVEPLGSASDRDLDLGNPSAHCDEDLASAWARARRRGRCSRRRACRGTHSRRTAVRPSRARSSASRGSSGCTRASRSGRRRPTRPRPEGPRRPRGRARRRRFCLVRYGGTSRSPSQGSRARDARPPPAATPCCASRGAGGDHEGSAWLGGLHERERPPRG